MRAVAAGLAGMAGVALLLASAAIWATQDSPDYSARSTAANEIVIGARRVTSGTTGQTHTAGAGMNRPSGFAAGSDGDGDPAVLSVAYGGRPVTRVVREVAGTTSQTHGASATPTASPTLSVSATPTASPSPTATLTPRPPFAWPAEASISQPMAENHPYGIDIAVRFEPVYAVRDGRVTFVGGDPCCSYGLFVVVEHDQGWTSLYAHLETFAVGLGDDVTQGQRIGRSGETGKARGPHLHFELRSWGTPLDPVPRLPAR